MTFDSYIPVTSSVYCLGWGAIHSEELECQDRHKVLYIRGGETAERDTVTS